MAGERRKDTVTRWVQALTERVEGAQDFIDGLDPDNRAELECWINDVQNAAGIDRQKEVAMPGERKTIGTCERRGQAPYDGRGHPDDCRAYCPRGPYLCTAGKLGHDGPHVAHIDEGEGGAFTWTEPTPPPACERSGRYCGDDEGDEG